jgi:membrane fusion protein, multidrug efflux system
MACASPPFNEDKKMITWRLFGLTLVAMALAACERKPPPPEPPRPVLTQVVGAQSDAARVTYSGAVQARFEQTLSFRVGGKLTRRSVDAGQRVKAGAELARLDPQDNALNVQAARAQIAQVEANLKLARNELDRAKSLHERNFIAQSVVDQRQAQVTAAEAQLQSARAQAAITGNQAGYTVLRAEMAIAKWPSRCRKAPSIRYGGRARRR